MKKWSGLGSELGRSMIEMLGVLAIVGVLSVGGVSGFQKAMNKHKINQVTEELSQFINELLRYSKDWRRMYVSNDVENALYLASELDFLIPTKWKRKDGYWIYDSMGNKMVVRLRQGKTKLRIDVTYRFNVSQDKKSKIDLCMAYYDRLKPYADSLWGVMVWRQASDDSDQGLWVYGNTYCNGGDKKCLKDLTLNEMRERCSVFQSDDKGNNFEIYFPI